MHLFRMTHLKNIPHILQHGITHKTSINANANYVPIGDSQLISKRNTITEPIFNRHLGDYIPFYFATRTPMLYAIQTGYSVSKTAPEKIVYCVCKTNNIIKQQLPFIFTDGHAVDGLSEFYGQKDLANLDNLLDWEAIKTNKWGNSYGLDIKRKKEAEFLVLGDLPVSCIIGYAVYNEQAKQQLIHLGVSSKTIGIRKEFYY